MHIESIQLRNFRNFEDEKLNLCERFNLFIGKNAQGKTNIIEAISMLASGRSFRSSEFRDLKRWNCDSACIWANAIADRGASEIEIKIDDMGKGFYRNGKKSRGGFSTVATVLFAPEETALLKDSPAARREYVDEVIAKVVPQYKSLLLRFGRILSQRNRMLKDSEEVSALLARTLRPWDEQVARLGARITVERAQWCERINAFLPAKYFTVAPKDGEALFCYRPHCGDKALLGGEACVERSIAEALESRREDEVLRGITLSGPHRDDFEARIEGAPAKKFSSQGQHRTFILSLKMAEVELLKEALGETPILLLDDVASELDRGRNEFFFNYLKSLSGQVFITATDADSVLIDSGANMRRFTVVEGRANATG